MKLALRNTVPARDQSEIKKNQLNCTCRMKKNVNLQRRGAQIDSLRPKKVPYSLCRDVMARACTESNQRSKSKLEAQFPFKIPPILHTYTCHSTTVIRVQYAIGLPYCFLGCISIIFDRNRRSLTLD